MLPTLCLLHSSAEQQFVHELSSYLETGCDVICRIDDGILDDGESIVDRAESLGLGSDVLLVLLSQSTVAAGWPNRARWESILVSQAREQRVDIVYFQLEDCAFPSLLQRGATYFDARPNQLAAMRRLKRWLWRRTLPNNKISDGFEMLYATVADRVGSMSVSGETARAFVDEAAQEFAAVVWVPCHGRSTEQIVGHAGTELGMKLDGPLRENIAGLLRELELRRCLLILDGGTGEIFDVRGRSSVLCTTDPVVILETVDSYKAARDLVLADRHAEALEILKRLLPQSGMDPLCRRELVAILRHWGEWEKANEMDSGSSFNGLQTSFAY